MTYQEKAQDLYNMINSGQLLDAFDKYYHQNCVMVEATGDRREGKDVNRQYEEKFLSSIKEFHGAGVGSIASNEENKVTTVESWMDVTFQDDNRVKLEQVAVQKWDGDHIVNERFYYNAGS
ncbi:SnoaL-like domain-containing protein [Tunicatimonas pelagia]|uniref:SnoaL-like domain-containing protein n=1 Tax=Tunicatimonas pelagia TaxID=931531 RepID=UPI002666D4C1|nr:SnoaL-like domain-containing protein [Tunicatimonas pelagia]WKN43737.1 nuclear transport factor 2 family protein [Tunicatimonas pelagia]